VAEHKTGIQASILLQLDMIMFKIVLDGDDDDLAFMLNDR
jgi:hypothetical protein